MFWIYVLVVVVMRCIAAFMQNKAWFLVYGIYIIDLALAYKIVLGLYFYYNDYLQTMYIHDGYYVILFIYLAFYNSFTYILSTLYVDHEKKYNYKLGFIFMEISTIVVCVLFKKNYDIMTMGLTKYYLVILFWTFVNLYVAFDTYLILNYRSDCYTDDDYLYGYYALWCDWFSFFWVDILSIMDGK